jgi:hypothetical protein
MLMADLTLDGLTVDEKVRVFVRSREAPSTRLVVLVD